MGFGYHSLMANAHKKLGKGPKRHAEPLRSSGGKGLTLGREEFARISAVEGIRLSRKMQNDLREFDRKGLSAEERRREIVRKYGKAPA